MAHHGSDTADQSQRQRSGHDGATVAAAGVGGANGGCSRGPSVRWGSQGDSEMKLDVDEYYEAKDELGKWWPVTLLARNGDEKTYTAHVHDGTTAADGTSGKRWPSVYPVNVRVLDVSCRASQAGNHTPPPRPRPPPPQLPPPPTPTAGPTRPGLIIVLVVVCAVAFKYMDSQEKKEQRQHELQLEQERTRRSETETKARLEQERAMQERLDANHQSQREQEAREAARKDEQLKLQEKRELLSQPRRELAARAAQTVATAPVGALTWNYTHFTKFQSVAVIDCHQKDVEKVFRNELVGLPDDVASRVAEDAALAVNKYQKQDCKFQYKGNKTDNGDFYCYKVNVAKVDDGTVAAGAMVYGVSFKTDDVIESLEKHTKETPVYQDEPFYEDEPYYEDVAIFEEEPIFQERDEQVKVSDAGLFSSAEYKTVTVREKTDSRKVQKGTEKKYVGMRKVQKGVRQVFVRNNVEEWFEPKFKEHVLGHEDREHLFQSLEQGASRDFLKLPGSTA